MTSSQHNVVSYSNRHERIPRKASTGKNKNKFGKNESETTGTATDSSSQTGAAAVNQLTENEDRWVLWSKALVMIALSVTTFIMTGATYFLTTGQETIASQTQVRNHFLKLVATIDL